MNGSLRVLALAGGVGGAKLAEGLAQILGERLTVLVNTGDDFEHFGFRISPDLDTVVYTLAGIANPETGWGLKNESWEFMDQIGQLGGPTWFSIGDRDAALHALRTSKLLEGETLTAITRDICRSLGVQSVVLPMSNDRVRTIIHSDTETFSFQDYFVRLKCAPPVSKLSYDGVASARPNPLLSKLSEGDGPLATIICPSNPYLSIDPILSLSSLREWIAAVSDITIAVSPIVGGAAIKGPAAKIMKELKFDSSATAVAQHYRELIDGFILDEVDAKLADEVSSLNIDVLATQTVMRNAGDRFDLAQQCLAFVEKLLRRSGG